MSQVASPTYEECGGGAAETYARAISSVQYQSAEAAKTALDSLLAKGSSAGPYTALARLQKGALLAGQSKHDEAIVELDAYLAGSISADYLRQVALVTKAGSQEASDQVDAARTTLTEAAAIEGPYTGQALAAQARLADAADDSDAAVAAIERLLEVDPDGPDTDRLAKRLAQLMGSGAE